MTGPAYVKARTARCISGHWRNHYDTRDLNSPDDVQIDHVVPLGEAWRSGASKWRYERRREFANDLDSPELLAASARSNSAKQDSPPNEWKPDRRRSWCLYARWWVEVKRTWKLTVTKDEKTALRRMLADSSLLERSAQPGTSAKNPWCEPCDRPVQGGRLALACAWAFASRRRGLEEKVLDAKGPAGSWRTSSSNGPPHRSRSGFVPARASGSPRHWRA